VSESCEEILVRDLVLFGFRFDELNAFDERPKRVRGIEFDAEKEGRWGRWGRRGDDEVGVSRVAMQEDGESGEEEMESSRSLLAGSLLLRSESSFDSFRRFLLLVRVRRIALVFVEERQSKEGSARLGIERPHFPRFYHR
jgi:hypothetical protein